MKGWTWTSRTSTVQVGLATRRGSGSLPPDFSVPEGGFPEGSPQTVPSREAPLLKEGFPADHFPRGARPEGGVPGGQDPVAFLAGVLGLDADDPDVVAAINACSDELGA